MAISCETSRLTLGQNPRQNSTSMTVWISSISFTVSCSKCNKNCTMFWNRMSPLSWPILTLMQPSTLLQNSEKFCSSWKGLTLSTKDVSMLKTNLWWVVQTRWCSMLKRWCQISLSAKRTCWIPMYWQRWASIRSTVSLSQDWLSRITSTRDSSKTESNLQIG